MARGAANVEYPLLFPFDACYNDSDMENGRPTREFKGKSLFAFPSDFTVVDIETTGLSSCGAEILEVSALRYREDKFVASFSSLIKPSAHIPYFITQLTGITDRMVANAADRKGVLRDFAAFAGEDILIGHNVNFDVNFLYDELLFHLGTPLKNDFVDVLKLSRRYLPGLPDHKQMTVASYFGQDVSGSHRALRDTEICAENYLGIKRIALRS